MTKCKYVLSETPSFLGENSTVWVHLDITIFVPPADQSTHSSTGGVFQQADLVKTLNW